MNLDLKLPKAICWCIELLALYQQVKFCALCILCARLEYAAFTHTESLFSKHQVSIKAK